MTVHKALSCLETLQIVDVLLGELEAKLEKSKKDITKNSERFAEKQRDRISNNLLESLDEASLGEVNDNSWLHKQVCAFTHLAEGDSNTVHT